MTEEMQMPDLLGMIPGIEPTPDSSDPEPTVAQRKSSEVYDDETEHEWQKKRTYDLPGPRFRPTVTVYECTSCPMIVETSRWHDPDPQYFEEDTKEADRITDSDTINACPEAKLEVGQS